MTDFKKIYLSWRKGQGSRRYLVGLLEKNALGAITFNYDKKETSEALKEGFAPYTELPDIDKVYDEYAMQVFSQRLMKSERPDIQLFYDFWEIEPSFKNDPFYLLGHTQGLLPTDNFEFLADYEIHQGLHFLTELASLSHTQLLPKLLSIDDVLSIEREPENQYDNNAVKVLKDNELIGYVKKVHSRIFYKKDSNNLQLSVKAIEKNGIIKKLFVKIQSN